MSGVTWVWILLIAYIVYCFYWGIEGAVKSKTAGDYVVAGRQIPMIAFLLAATAASFSGWTFIGHPGLIWKDGLAYAFASFYVLTIPITGTFFAKRVWLLGKRYGFITPGDMYAYYFGNEGMRWLVVIAAFLYSAFYSAVQFMAAGSLFHWVTGFSYEWGAIFLAVVVLFYVAAGGLRASTWVGVMQCVALVAGIIILGVFVLIHFGGWTDFSAKLATLPKEALEIPSLIEFTTGKQIWTTAMILTYMFSLMGIQSSPAFTMWQFANKNPRPFAWQQAFASTWLVGFALFFFTAIQGMGGKFLTSALGIAKDGDVVPSLMQHFVPGIWLGIVFIGAIAAMHSTAAPYVGTGSTIMCRDVYFRYIRPQAGHGEQIWTSRILALAITIVALYVGMTSTEALVMLGGLATAFGFIMYLPLLGTIWGLRFPGIGAVLGTLAGIVAVYLTFGVFKYPLTIHSAGWGIIAALAVAYLCRGLGVKDSPEIRERQREVREWLNSIDSPTLSQKRWRNILKVGVPLWYLFAIGPFAILGNHAFSFAGFPPLWAWQIVWWLLGMIMMWALCFKAGMATITEEQIMRAEVEQKIVVDEVHAPATPKPSVSKS
ncbi:MAG: sodium:solute symporter family protein [Bacillota bacterium]